MHPVLFHFHGFTLYTYGLFVALGFMAALWVSRRLAVARGVSSDLLGDVFLVALLSGLAGARILYVIINFEVYRNNWLDIFKLWNGGLVFFGGFLAALAGTSLYLHRRRQNILKMADILSPGLALGHAVGRIGCFFAGCCYGKTCDLPFAVRFSDPDSLAPLGVNLHPTQLYEVGSNLILFFILIQLLPRKAFDGMVFLVYLMLYALFRFVIEFFRGDFRGEFIMGRLSVSQGIGLLVFAAAFLLFIRLFKSSRNGPDSL